MISTQHSQAVQTALSQNTRIKTALISVFDKTGIVELAKTMSAYKIKLISTGGTSRLLKDSGLDVVDVSDLTGFPEILDGRVKTLHPNVHAGILSRRNVDADLKTLQDHGIEAIDLVITNLYPFEQTIKSGASPVDCIENIDIGGPSMIRAAAKNCGYVTVITDPSDYADFEAELKETDGAVTPKTRQLLSAKAFQRTAAYDSLIANWMMREDDQLPSALLTSAPKILDLRYGENAHQKAATYQNPLYTGPSLLSADLVQGKALSFNNINDTDAAFKLVCEFETPSIAIIKHANPCGVGSGKTLSIAYEKALACDPVSAFGGIIAANGEIDGETATLILKTFCEVVIAPSISEKAKQVFAKKPNIRVLETKTVYDPALTPLDIRTITGGYLVQSSDSCVFDTENALNVVTKRQPTEDELADLRFAFTVCKHVKSNGIVYAKDLATVGIGAGQMSRVDSSRIAAWKAGEAAQNAGLDTSLAQNSVVASDAFFPFPDGLLAAANAGATAVIQPGGSIRDQDVIDAANDHGLAMIMTGIRHFKH